MWKIFLFQFIQFSQAVLMIFYIIASSKYS